jgi:hypothetical protein
VVCWDYFWLKVHAAEEDAEKFLSGNITDSILSIATYMKTIDIHEDMSMCF